MTRTPFSSVVLLFYCSKAICDGNNGGQKFLVQDNQRALLRSSFADCHFCHGIDKFHPYGPTCVVGGKSVEVYVTCSESGLITSDILTNVLFLDYINNPSSKWTVCIGMPYGTNLWQVGDSSQQNGAYKMCLTVEKHNLLEKKTKLCLDTKIERHDAVGLVHRAWLKSFMKVESNINFLTTMSCIGLGIIIL